MSSFVATKLNNYSNEEKETLIGEEMIDVEVIRFETDSPDGTLDYYLEDVKALCRAFGYSFKRITQYVNDKDPIRMYEIYLSIPPFYVEDQRNVIKTFILHNYMILMHVKTIKMDLYELLDMPEGGISEEENLLVNEPNRKR